MSLERSLEDRVLGCILGGALGDGLGGPFEGRAATHSPRIPESLHLSDDTQLTLATCEALTTSGGVSPQRIASTFAQWHRARRFTGLGASTAGALEALARGGHWALVGRRGEFAAGNGAAMRIAPLAFVLDPRDPANQLRIRDVCRITHHSDEAFVGALAVCFAVRDALAGSFNVHAIAARLPDSAVRDRLAALVERTGDLAAVMGPFGRTGWVVDSAPLAIVGAKRIADGGFERALPELIALGGDTGTNAAMAGQIAGTLLGASSLPSDWLARLVHREELERTARSFAKEIARSSSVDSPR